MGRSSPWGGGGIGRRSRLLWSRSFGNGDRDALKFGELFRREDDDNAEPSRYDGRCRDWTGAAYVRNIS